MVDGEFVVSLSFDQRWEHSGKILVGHMNNETTVSFRSLPFVLMEIV